MAERRTEDDPDLISRAEVARLLGCSKGHVPRLESRGELKSVWTTPKGNVLHSRTATLALLNQRIEQSARTPAPAASTAAVAATVAAQTITPEQVRALFVAFREKRSLGEIVEATGLLPDQVRSLYVQYQTPLDAPPPRPQAVASSVRADDEQRADREYQARMREFDAAQQERHRRQDAEDAARRRRASEIETSRRQLDQQRSARISARLARLSSRANPGVDRDGRPIYDPDHGA